MHNKDLYTSNLMEKKYLLYIDILGFSKLVEDDYKMVDELYKILNQINAHYHPVFHVICFSDTLLVYNVIDPVNIHDVRNCVQYLIEFVRDLMFRLAKHEINFRAVIVFDEFKHYYRDKIECFYGNSLIRCYKFEKQINGMGLFIDKTLTNIISSMPIQKYDENLDFVSLLFSLDSISKYYPNHCQSNIPKELIDNSDEFISIKIEIKILKHIYNNSINNSNPKIRSKYLQTYQLYKNIYGELLIYLEKSNFELKSISLGAKWSLLSDY
jgi:hypothetical protein